MKRSIGLWGALAVVAMAATAQAQSNPQLPAALEQWQADGVTPIPAGGMSSSMSVVCARIANSGSVGHESCLDAYQRSLGATDRSAFHLPASDPFLDVPGLDDPRSTCGMRAHETTPRGTITCRPPFKVPIRRPVVGSLS